MHAVLRDAIAAIPNLLQSTVHGKFAAAPHTVVHTQTDVAERIASVLPDSLRQRGCLLVDLPPVAIDEFGHYCVRVSMSSQAWSYTEVRASRRGGVLIKGLPRELAAGDARALAAALFAIERVVSSEPTARAAPRRPRPPHSGTYEPHQRR